MNVAQLANILTIAASFIGVSSAIVAFVRYIQARRLRFSPEADVARRLLIFLGDRRVIYSEPEGTRTVDYAAISVVDIRKRLGTDLEIVRSDTPLAKSISAMQQACRQYLDEQENFRRELRESIEYKELSRVERWALRDVKARAAEKTLREVFRKEILNISAMYRITAPQALP